MPRSLITFLTDFGVEQTYVAQMKGVILGLNPEALIVDVTHSISAQNVFHGALSLDEVFDAFPTGTIHVVVVDPGVGSSRRRIGVEIGTQRFVGPDNGLLSLISKRQPIQRVHELTEPRFHRQPVSPTFHGRDIFAPVAAYWSLGEDLSRFGPRLESALQAVAVPEIARQTRRVAGEIIAIDRFGNLISNVERADLPANFEDLITEIAGEEIRGVQQFYAERPSKSLLALFGSNGRLEIAQNGGSAAQALSARIGAPVGIRW